MQVSAVILAGGQSKRMGRDKAWLQFQGRPLIERMLETVRTLGIAEIFISARADQNYSALNCPVLFDDKPGLGPISGVASALRCTQSNLLLVLPVDLPRMTASCLRKLLDSCEPPMGAVAELRDQIEPLIAVYPKRCREYALMNMTRGEYAVQQFASACLREHAVRIFRVPDSDAPCFTNCNTPEDLARL